MFYKKLVMFHVKLIGSTKYQLHICTEFTSSSNKRDSTKHLFRFVADITAKIVIYIIYYIKSTTNIKLAYITLREKCVLN